MFKNKEEEEEEEKESFFWVIMVDPKQGNGGNQINTLPPSPRQKPMKVSKCQKILLFYLPFHIHITPNNSFGENDCSAKLKPLPYNPFSSSSSSVPRNGSHNPLLPWSLCSTHHKYLRH